MILYILYRIGQVLACILPASVRYSIAVFISWLKFLTVGEERTGVRKNLQKIVGKNNPHISKYTFQMYANFGKYLSDFLQSGNVDKKFVKRYITIENLHYMDQALEKGKGAIGVTAHIGNWELCAQILAVLGYKMNAVALIHGNDRLDNFFNEQRRKTGINVIPVGMAVRQCFSALKRNEIVGILGDRDFSGENGIFVEFCKSKMLIPKGPAILSLRTGAAIVPAWTAGFARPG